MEGFSHLSGVATLRLDTDACTGCGICVTVCPHQVLELSGTKAEIRDFDACMECGACMVNCPAGAIWVDAGVGCASGLINEWLAGLRGGRGTGGGCC